MERLSYVNHFRDLKVYQKSRDLSWRIYKISKDFPIDECYSLTNQIRRSSRSIGAQLAEAWAKRTYKKHFISKLTDADAELNETEHWIDVAHSCEYIGLDEKKILEKDCRELGRMIGSMIRKADLFCKIQADG